MLGTDCANVGPFGEFVVKVLPVVFLCQRLVRSTRVLPLDGHISFLAGVETLSLGFVALQSESPPPQMAHSDLNRSNAKTKIL